MQKHKSKIIAVAAIVALLSAAWFFGGSPSASTVTADAAPSPTVMEVPMLPEVDATPSHADATAPGRNHLEPGGAAAQLPTEAKPDESLGATELDELEAAPLAKDYPLEVLAEAPGEAPVKFSDDTQEQAAEISDSGSMEKRAPVELEDMAIGDESFYVTLSVRAHMILYNMHLLHKDKHELVPEDGWIFPPAQVRAYEGESVFNVLQREMRRNRIHMASRFTPMFNSAYVEAINNLFEFDVGPLSGWMYSVNGWFPDFGASRYLLSPDDVIEWVYTVDLGRDLGVDVN
ncbi:MAG: DUF4430 domain-containing protein [Oscillospiraceae bacterium]|nr:DUF4430 domain-containing protein [Oscillospiraceae bacterium]